MKVVPFDEAQGMLQEADVLLFRAGSFPSIGWWITRYTGGKHSHVAIAHKDGRDWYCVEQREFKGGRSVLLKGQAKKYPSVIDVYRAPPFIMLPDESGWHKLELDEQRKNDISRTALEITGQPYGWSNIWGIFKGYAPGFRLFRGRKNGDEEISQAYVCSTTASYSYRIHYADPCPNLKDDRTSPSDIAQSALFHYMFTIGEV